MRRTALLFVSAAWMAATTVGFAAADDWPQFRGPAMDGVVRDNPALPERWSASENVAWRTAIPGLGWSSPVVWGNYYTLLDGGFITCHDAKTGAEVYGRQRIDAGATFTASPWAYNGKLFLLSEDGNTYVVQAGPLYKLLGNRRGTFRWRA